MENLKLYEYKGILWNILRFQNGTLRIIPYCPEHKMELDYSDVWGKCEDCNKVYNWGKDRDHISEYLRRKLSSNKYKQAEIITIDGIQIPQVKTKIRIPEENIDYWIEGRINNSEKGRQVVFYIGDKSPGKAQIFANIDQEKLSFDHKDRKPEDIVSKITVEFPSSKKMIIEA